MLLPPFDYSVLDALADPVFIVDGEWRYLHHNAQAARYTARSLEELRGRTLWEAFPQLLNTPLEGAYRCAMSNRVRIDLEADSDESGRCYAVTATPCGDGLCVQFHEITEERRAALELRASEARYRQLLEQATDAIFIFDGAGRFHTVNTTACEALGYTRDELLRMSIADIVMAGEIERQPVDLAALRSGIVVRRERFFRRKDGTSFVAEINSKLLGLEPTPLFQAIARDVTAQKRMNDALADSRALLEAAEEMAHVGSWALDVGSGLVSWSQEMYRIFDFDPETTTPSIAIFLERVHPCDRRSVEEAMAGILADGNPRSLEWRLRRRNGEVCTIQAHGRAHRAPNGEIVRLLGSAQDITERVEADRALRRAHQLLATMIEDAPVAVITVDDQYRVTSWNPAAEHIFGWSAGEVIGRPLPLVPEERAMELPLINGAEEACGFTTVPYETQRRRRDGAMVDVQVATAPLRGSRGDIVGAVAFISDLTERNEARQALRAREEQHRVVTDGLPVLIAYIDRDERYRFVNRAYVEALNVTASALLDRRVEEVLPPADYAAVRPHIRAALAGEPRSFEKDLTAGGALRYMSISYLPHRDLSGDVVGMYALLTDATERRDLEEQLRQSQKMEAVGRLAGGVAHDFNNLLTVVTVHCEMLIAMLPDASPLRSDIDAIQQAGRKAASLTRQLLAFSRRQVFTLEVFGINDVVGDVQKMFRRVIGEDVQLDCRFAPDAGAVRADRAQLTQVLVNLIVNARDAMPDGGTITMSTANASIDALEARRREVTPGEYVRFALRDTGQGMDAGTQARIFEPFFTTKEPGKGTGLGLSTVYGIVKQLDGFIDVVSAPGEGTTFTVHLPRASAPATKTTPTSVTATPRGSEVVLLVEDDEGVRTIARRALEAQGYVVLAAATADAAIAIARAHAREIALLLTDVVMPSMSGPVLANVLRDVLPNAAVLFMSGYSDASIESHGVLAPGASLIEKPFTVDALARKVREVLKR